MIREYYDGRYLQCYHLACMIFPSITELHLAGDVIRRLVGFAITLKTLVVVKKEM